MFVSLENDIIKVTLLTLFKLLVLLGGVVGDECPMVGWCMNLPELDLAGETGAGETSAEQHVVAARISVS